MVARHLTVLLVIILLSACGGAPAASKYAQFNGTWQSDLLTFSIDLDKLTYTNVSGGLTDAPITILAEQANEVRFNLADDTAGTAPWTLRLQEDGKLMVVAEGMLPVILTRAP